MTVQWQYSYDGGPTWHPFGDLESTIIESAEQEEQGHADFELHGVDMRMHWPERIAVGYDGAKEPSRKQRFWLLSCRRIMLPLDYDVPHPGNAESAGGGGGGSAGNALDEEWYDASNDVIPSQPPPDTPPPAAAVAAAANEVTPQVDLRQPMPSGDEGMSVTHVVIDAADVAYNYAQNVRQRDAAFGDKLLLIGVLRAIDVMRRRGLTPIVFFPHWLYNDTRACEDLCPTAHEENMEVLQKVTEMHLSEEVHVHVAPEQSTYHPTISIGRTRMKGSDIELMMELAKGHRAFLCCNDVDHIGFYQGGMQEYIDEHIVKYTIDVDNDMQFVPTFPS
ncbi:unnamed protein product [Vitrella brassicaformis CCMP3155]|uniref:WWE domain-containing protein n=2 Tax=Vitrella brassicaformis TaxID=1169539 RepID=A0A0G4E9G8_VITBC|nr:unnamed protein product [Vitrella brassicaformis CCMP3155]|mmetsp:Transcript_28895/g.72034  ORF Transcript_28895/g.72034 Transcript_28895/m.72034 type:complete len:334 (+) Transcript_28895:42-1043(+)|eukprot:CEL91883.1 unnamed protein product [Vitrella brassicaformis CCMP3155]